jgi:hypothetical protein
MGSKSRRLRRKTKESRAMGMKYFQVPEDVTIQSHDEDGNQITKNGEPLQYSFRKFNRDHVWTSEQWRTGSADAAEHFDTCYAAIEEADPKPGDIIGLPDAAHEFYLPIVTMRAVKLNSHLAVPFNRLMRPVMRATSKKPEVAAKQTNGDAKTEPPAEEASAN